MSSIIHKYKLLSISVIFKFINYDWVAINTNLLTLIFKGNSFRYDGIKENGYKPSGKWFGSN